jgi:hypothetical protein
MTMDLAGGVASSNHFPTFRKVLSPKNTALFYQLDRRVQLLIDIQLASSLPMIEP